MVLRIEYLLAVTLVILLLSILGINPRSQSAVSATGNKEILFQNFSLFELKEQYPEQTLYATQTIKYENRLDLKDINVTDKEGHNIIAHEAIYQNDDIYMNQNVTLTQINGLTFSTEMLTYNLKRKELQTFTPFHLDFNGSRVIGSKLNYNLQKKEISADNIEASILFIAPGEDANRTEGKRLGKGNVG